MGKLRHSYSIFALIGCLSGLIAAATALSAGWAYRIELLPLREAFSLLRWAAYGGAAGFAVSVLGLTRTWPGSPRKGLWLALLGMVVGAGVFLIPYDQYRRAKQVPPIHDITTDTTNPPQFKAVLPLRPGSSNSLDYGGEKVSAQQRRAYPEVGPLTIVLPPASAFEAALEAARRMGWQIVDSSPASGRIEAVDSTLWFGFQDDVVVRLTGTNGGTQVDVRSVSRVGVSDVGKNAERIREYLDDLRSHIHE